MKLSIKVFISQWFVHIYQKNSETENLNTLITELLELYYPFRLFIKILFLKDTLYVNLAVFDMTCCCEITVVGIIVRSSRSEVFCNKDVLRNFAKFTGKPLCQSPFLNKVAGLRPDACSFIKKRLWHRCFPVNFAKFLGTPFLKEHHWWLLLL